MIYGTAMLMHRNIPVAECTFDKQGFLSRIDRVLDEERLPVIAQGEHNRILNLQKWILGRTPARGRRDYAELAGFYGNGSLTTADYASLFDCYWLRTDEETTWEDVEYFSRYSQSDDYVMRLLLSPADTSRSELDGRSPNLTLPGAECRVWGRDAGGLFLLYFSAKSKMDEYKAGTAAGVQLLPREYVVGEHEVLVKVPYLGNGQTEYISLDEFYQSCPKEKGLTKGQNLVRCCEFFDIPGWQGFISQVLALDEATGNEDRELGSLGVLRDAGTLELIGFHAL